MPTYSLSDIATRSLRDLGLLGANETASADDLSFAEETISAVVAQLTTEGVNIIGGSDQVVPQEYLVQLSKRVGLDIGPAFGLFTIAEAEPAKIAANMALRRMNALQPTGSVSESEYY